MRKELIIALINMLIHLVDLLIKNKERLNIELLKGPMGIVE